MFSNFAIFATALTLGQVPDNDTGPAAVKLVRGQELVYRGSVHEESSSAGAIVRKAYEVECHTFVLSSTDKGFELAFQTVLRSPGATTKPGSVRLELANSTGDGRIEFLANGTVRSAPDGPPTLEPAGIVELTRREHPVDYIRGVRCIRVARTELYSGGTCTETVWIAAQTGIVRKLDRTFERRMGGEQVTTFRASTTYELASEITIPDSLAAGRRREIRQAWQAQQKLAELLPNAGRVGPQKFERVLITLAGHVESEPASPYRPAVLWLQDRAAAGKRGEAPAPSRPQ